MAAYTCSITILNSKQDKFGNCYWAFIFVDHATRKTVCATVQGGDSNIRGIARHWNVPDGSILWHSEELKIKEFDRMVKNWSWAGDTPAEMAQFIRDNLSQQPRKTPY